ncbi:MAG TPA: N-6 DNA methylase, partial [Caldisericia bacterium]|nr:N-6 DNA methylase [Caldisericia bacterium]
REIYPHWESDKKWREQIERLVNLLTPEEIATAARSTQYAHYTSPAVINSIYKALDKFGFKGGKVLEPGMGVGSFFGLMPESMRNTSIYTGIEFDAITAKIAKHLYQNQNIIAADYTKQKLPNGFFDLAIGNPPFSSTKILTDPDYKKLRLSLHDYFFVKSLDKVRPGGLLVFITSRYTMDKQDDRVRQILNEKADLLGAIRLPQTAFKQNAGTEVVTDVILLRKKAPGETSNGMDWKNTSPVTTENGEFPVNEYYVQHPEMVLGKHSGQGSMYKANEYTVMPLEGDIEQAFAKAVDTLPENVYSIVKASTEDQKKIVIEQDFNPANKKEGGAYLSDKGHVMITEQGRG